LDYIDKEGIRFNERKNLLDVARGVVYGNEAKVYIQSNNFHIAEILLKKSIAINLRKGNDNRDAESSELRLAHLYYQVNKIDSLKKILQVVRPQLDSIKNLDVEVDWNLMQANYFINKNNSHAALNYFIKYDALKDSIITINKALKEADISGQIKRLEKEYELGQLKKNDHLKSFYLKVEAALALMLLFIVFMILFTWQKSRKNIKTLGSLNDQINRQNYDLEHALQELKLSIQEKDRILRTVAHDLRNPIGGIASLTEAMAHDEYTTEQREMIGLIKETSHNSLELINEILEITNNETASQNRELVDINSLLNHSAELLRFRAAEKKQEIKLELLQTPQELFISREKIWRVMSNLIVNAIKFSPEGSVIYVKITDNAKDVSIAVKDSGIGIPDDIKDKVFNIFTEAKRPGTSGEKSFGLGLSICKQIIENHHGKIWFDSDVNNGTTFYVSLPKL
jgi:signal transduction histidine kinase